MTPHTARALIVLVTTFKRKQQTTNMTSRTTIQRMIASLPLDLATAELETAIDNLAYEVAPHRFQTISSGDATCVGSAHVSGVTQSNATDVSDHHALAAALCLPAPADGQEREVGAQRRSRLSSHSGDHHLTCTLSPRCLEASRLAIQCNGWNEGRLNRDEQSEE